MFRRTGFEPSYAVFSKDLHISDLNKHAAAPLRLRPCPEPELCQCHVTFPIALTMANISKQ